MRPTIPKLAASAVPGLQSKPKFRNELLQQTWPQDVNYLRDTYTDAAEIWDKVKQDNKLYDQTVPKLNELIQGLMDVAVAVPRLTYVGRDVNLAKHDADIATMYAKAGDYYTAISYQAYALTKLHAVLESLTREASKRPFKNTSSTEKTAYGYDISGEVFEGSGEIANRENQTNINDTAQPQDHHETPVNPANVTMDSEAEEEFKELRDFKHKRVHWPPRNR